MSSPPPLMCVCGPVQTPKQLFEHPHPARLVSPPTPNPMTVFSAAVRELPDPPGLAYPSPSKFSSGGSAAGDEAAATGPWLWPC